MTRAKLVGGAKFAAEFAQVLRNQAIMGGSGIMSPLYRFQERDDATSSMAEQIFGDCYYLVVTSMDVDALARRQIKPLPILWRIHMTTAAYGVALDQVMPGLIDNGAYFFGRDMKAPEVVTKRAMREGRVEIGEAVVKEYILGTGTNAPVPSRENADKNPGDAQLKDKIGTGQP